VPRLSIIIPALGNAARLETTLVSVLENRPPDCEILVVHTGAYDDPYDLHDEIRFLEMSPRASLVACINRAVETSTGSLIHLLSAGFQVTEGWTEKAIAHFCDPRVASVAPLVVDVLENNVVIAAGLRYSCRRGRIVNTTLPDNTGQRSSELLGPMLQAAFFRRSALELLGGLPSDTGDELADIDTALILLYAGYAHVLELQCVVMASANEIVPAPPGFRSGLAAERLFWRAAPIVGWAKSLGAHPLEVASECLRALPRPQGMSALLGRFLGACQVGRYRAHYGWLLDIQRTAAALFQGMRSPHLRVDAPHDSAPRPTAASGGVRVAVQSPR
jgi:glycosyl transferase family 2